MYNLSSEINPKNDKYFFSQLYSLLNDLKTEHDISLNLSKILNIVSEFLDVRNANIYISDKNKFFSVGGYNESNDIEINIPKNESEKMLSNYFVIDEDDISLYPSMIALNQNYLRAKIICPLSYDNNLLGFISLGYKISDDYQNDDKVIISLISNMIAKIIFYSDNYIDIIHKSADEIYLKTIIDSLTGLYIKTYTEQRMTENIKEALRYKKYDSFCMVKVENINTIRENFGQHVVNDIIAKSGNLLKNFIRHDVDLGGKYSEDTFLILLPSTQIKGAIIFSEKLKASLVKIRADHHLDLELSFSIGVTILESKDRNKENVIDKLLQSVEHSIKNGGNKVSFYHESKISENLSYFEKARGLSYDLLKNTIQNTYFLVDEDGNEIQYTNTINHKRLNIPKA